MIGELLPDQPALDNPGVLQAKNVTPYAQGYRPTRNLVPQTDALTGPCKGAALLQSATGVIYNYAGDSTDIYTRTGDSWTSVQNGYTLGDDDRWAFDRWYDTVLAVNGVDKLQVGDFNGTMADADTAAPIGRHIAVARNFVMIGNLIENNQGTAPIADAAGVSWSALGDPTKWDIEVSGEQGFQHLDGSGEVTGIFGGEYFTICMQGGIYRANPVGPPAQFQFDQVMPNRPVPYSGAIVQVGYGIYFLSYDGFYMFDGNTAHPISSGKMSKVFFDDFDRDAASVMTAEADLENNLIYFAYPGQGHQSGICNRAYVYNYITGLWTGPIEQDTQQLIYSRTPGVQSDDFDQNPADLCDSAPYDTTFCDDSKYLGGNDPILGAFIPGNTYGVPNGPVKTAVVESGEFAHNKGGYAMVSGFRPFVDGNSPVVRGKICFRNSTSGDLEACPLVNINPRTGSVDQRVNARYHRYLVEVSGDFTSIHGGEPLVVPSSQR